MKEIISILAGKKFSLHSEKELQRELFQALSTKTHTIAEYPLDKQNIIDFYCEGIGIEVKIKGNRKNILKQCQRYCEFSDIKSLVLVTNRAMGLPASINNKPCAIVNLGLGWL